MIKNSIVLVPFPFDDLSDSKVRPALCLTSEIGRYKHVIIAFISSKIPVDLVESDIVIKKGSEEWKGSGLAVDSVIRLHKVVTIPKSLIRRKLGVISKKTVNEIEKKLMDLFLEDK
ncbi:type II toxin-antitoxin system PemK/MazF family toxin [Anaerophaga thermohalophila]|jgi:mRNA interferase MazF|uniref:type II toxin-antitoxin system PemK/MazF family toxin n=1 Tax=Anaerophaga thermohalophila TaxID=177400 RepID=UPI0003698732|nr:type II toxin-antitoxin system PemK/MazF family toxin [Anaerophaga thermohalophila]